MSRYSSASVPKPKNWQDFETSSSILFKCILQDDITSTHGRAGQAQQGVDIYGRRNGQVDQWVGVQCKQKDDGKEVTEKELKDEVEKAKKFRPALAEFILLTTAPDDAKIQEIVRKLTQEHHECSLFSVSVWGWETLETQITRFPEAIEAFHPDLTPFSRKHTALLKENLRISAEGREDQKDIKRLLEQIVQAGALEGAGNVISSIDSSMSANEQVDQHIHRDIDQYRDLLREGDAATAERLLTSLKERVWADASARARFRITTNIGAAALEQGREEEAAEAFLEAHGFDPTDATGRANVALAHILRGERQQAVVVAEEILDDDPANASAAAHLISGHIDNLDLNDPLALVPEEARDSAPVLVSAINFFCHRKDDEWRLLARRAAAEFPEEEHLQRRCAEAVLDEALASKDFKIGGRLPESITNDELDSSIALLQRLWDQRRPGAPWSTSWSALAQNLAMAQWVLGQYSEAAAVLDKALQNDPDDAEVREKRALVHFQAGDINAGLALVGDNVLDANLALAKAQALVRSRPPEARQTLDCEAIAMAPRRQKLAAALLTVETYVHEKKLEEALEKAEAAAQEYNWSLEPLRQLAEVQRLLVRSEANETLTTTCNKLSPETPFSERFLLATSLEDVQRHDDAIAVIEGHIDLSHDSPAVRLLISAYINADRRNSASNLLQELPKEVAASPFYLRAAAAMYVNRKDFPAALKAADRYLELRPDDIEMRLNWLSLCLRQGQEGRIAAFLADEKIEHSGPPELIMEIAQWMNQRGFEERALKLGYQVILDHSGVPGVHLRYMGLLLEPGRSEGTKLDRDMIAEDCAFEIENGGRKQWFIIEPDQELRKDAAYIAPGQEIAQKALDLKSGDEITWDDEYKEKKWTITDVKHKYLHALHQSMEKFEHWFPGDNSLERVPINFESQEPFAEVFARVKRRHDSIENVLNVLDSGVIPIHLPATVLGSDIVETRYGLIEAGRKHRVCLGTAPERALAFEAIRLNEKKGCLVDALTLNFIRRLGLEHTVQAVCGPIHVTGTTREIFWARVHSAESAKKPMESLFWRDGSICRQEITEEHWTNALKVRRQDLAWIDEHAELIPADSGSDAPSELRRIAQLIDRSFTDDMLAAQGAGMLLLCQDQAYRALASQYLGLKTSWLQPVLMIACDEGLIDRDDYNKIIISMIEFGDETISIDGELLCATSGPGSENAKNFELSVGCLGGPQADLLSHLSVAAGFLAVIWNKRSNEVVTQSQTGAIIKNLLKESADPALTIGALRAVYKIQFDDNPTLDQCILNWMKGHFLVSFESRTLPLVNPRSSNDIRADLTGPAHWIFKYNS